MDRILFPIDFGLILFAKVKQLKISQKTVKKQLQLSGGYKVMHFVHIKIFK